MYWVFRLHKRIIKFSVQRAKIRVTDATLNTELCPLNYLIVIP
jgi:hypothetical protein